MKLNSYVLVSGMSLRRIRDEMLLRCLAHAKALKIIKEMHEGVCGGHFSLEITSHRILKVGFY